MAMGRRISNGWKGGSDKLVECFSDVDSRPWRLSTSQTHSTSIGRASARPRQMAGHGAGRSARQPIPLPTEKTLRHSALYAWHSSCESGVIPTTIFEDLM